MLKEFHVNDKIVKGMNYSFLNLISKKKSPAKISDFRPISLVRCIYKFLSNVLGNTLKKEIDTLISKNQIALIFRRQMLDGTIVANEIVEYTRRKKKN